MAALQKLYGALSSDMEAGAAATGERALTEFRRANQYWRGRQTRISDVLSGVLGNNLNKGEGAAFEQINRWAQTKGGDFKRLSLAIRSMPTEEANTVRASVLARMGQASPGRQNADGLQFSPAEFATQWHKVSPRAKAVLFPDASHRANIDDIALAADGMKRAGQFANFSNTSLGTNAAVHVAGLVKSPILTLALAGGEYGLGKLLASPHVARWLARAPKTDNPASLRAYAKSLPKLAAANPAIAGDLRSLFTAINDNAGGAASQLPGRVAAEEQIGDSRGAPPE